MKSDNSIKLLGIVLVVVVIAVLSAAPQALPAIEAKSPAGNGEYFSYLPSITRPEPKGIYGLVTDGGVPAAGVFLELRWYDGSIWSTRASTTTDANGEYFFRNMSALGSGQLYYVRYLNGTDSSRLYTWHAMLIYDYAVGEEIEVATFDVANIELTDPASGAEVGLPYTFRWDKRTATPTDSYEFNLFDTDNDPYFYTDPSLGYVGSYTLSGLPAGFETNYWYLWDMWLYGPGGNADGDWGISYWAYWVSFTSGEMEGMPTAVVGGRVRAADLLLPRTSDQ